jgi:eukaryotic-like serine/threonine-protein kinase
MPAGVAFGSYQLIEKLGDGGMAMVYRGIVHGPEGFERPVVIKRILPDLSRDQKFVDMFLSEAKLCARLHHPNIVQVQALGEVDGEYFLAMEYIDGLDLATALKRAYDLQKPMPAGVACYIASELASALAYAHALTDASGRPLEIVHRDVNPANLMVTRHGAIKLLDFGIARAAAHARVRSEKTRTGTLKGKISYMSPEQAEGLPVDRRTDLFAVGIVLYECLTLERLFRGEDEFETLRLVREAKVFPPSSRRPEIDPDIDAIVLKLMARSPDGRYQSGDEVVAALSPIVHRLHGDAKQLRDWVSELSASTAEAALSPTTPASPGAKRDPDTTLGRGSGEIRPGTAPSRTRALALGAVLAAGVGGVVLLEVTRPPPPIVPPPVAMVKPSPVPISAPPPVVVPSPAVQVAAPPPVVAQPIKKRKPHKPPAETEQPEIKDPFAR